jgi:hypothetical protein
MRNEDKAYTQALESFKESHPQALVSVYKVVCYTCHGSGKVLCDGLRGVAFTQSEMDDMDDDFEDDYFGGRYDVGCPVCGGDNVVDETKFTDPAIHEEWEAYLSAWFQDIATDRAVRFAENGYRD